MKYFVNGVLVNKVKHLDLSDLWYFNESDIVEAKSISGFESFYPLYRWKSFYSYSPLKLIKLKGEIKYSSKILKYLNNGLVENFLPPEVFIDKEIKRIGKPIELNSKIIQNEIDFIKRFSEALIKDIKYLEFIHPDSTFIILTGGKDSLNLLLLPWKAKIVAVSQEPNYSLVVKFCLENKLNIEVLKLDGEEVDNLDIISKDVLFGCCRIGLADVRWSQSILNIKKHLNVNQENKVVVVSGALADSFTTPLFFKYKSKWQTSYISRLVNRVSSVRFKFFNTLWIKGAQWQGVFHGVIRESTNTPNYSAYHGRNVIKVLSETDFEKSVKTDIRADIGRFIYGKDIVYPSSNPSPPSWSTRKKYSSINYFKEVLNKEL